MIEYFKRYEELGSTYKQFHVSSVEIVEKLTRRVKSMEGGGERG